MRIKDFFTLRQLSEDLYVVESLNTTDSYNKIVTFNATAAFLWKVFKGKSFTLDDIANCIVKEYKIEVINAKRDASTLIEKWKEAGLIDQ